LYILDLKPVQGNIQDNSWQSENDKGNLSKGAKNGILQRRRVLSEACIA
jgi:hypothetical protein